MGEKKKPIYKKWWFWLIIVIIIGCIGAGTSQDNSGTQQTSTNPQETENQTIEYTKVNVDELDEALKNNAAAAKDNYNKKYLEIEGRLGTIDSDLKYISLLSTTDQYDILGIHCTIKNQEQKDFIKTLSKDDTITVKGKITNVGEVLGYYLDIIEITK